ncbi:MAG: hypothetical protein ACRDRA_22090 [Pseudonocardiaceae bacterium]
MDQFDPNLPNLMQGEITSVIVRDSGFVPNLVVDPTQNFFVDVEWEIFGGQVALYLNGADQFWDVSVYGESIGSSPEILLGSVTKDKADTVACTVNGPICSKYEARVTVVGSNLEEHIPGTAQSGIYKLAVAVFLNSNLGPAGFDLIGFKEGPMIQVENPI